MGMERHDGIASGLLRILAFPRTGIELTLLRQPVALGLFILVVGQISRSVATHLAFQGAGSISPVFDSFFACILAFAGVFIGTAFLHMFATILGGRGEIGGLFWGLMVGDAPWVIATPLVLIALGASDGSKYAYVLALFLIKMGLTVWAIGLKSCALAKVYRLSGSRALFAFFVGYGLAIVLFGLLAFFAPLSVLNWLAFLASRA